MLDKKNSRQIDEHLTLKNPLVAILHVVTKEETSEKTSDENEIIEQEINHGTGNIDDSMAETIGKHELGHNRDLDGLVKLINQNTENCVKKVTQVIKSCTQRKDKRLVNVGETKLERIEKKLLKLEETSETYLQRIGKRL